MSVEPEQKVRQLRPVLEPHTPLALPPIPQTDLREFLRILWRRRRIILLAVLLGVLGTGLLLTLVQPRYTATAQVMVDPRQANVLDVEQVLSGLPANAETIQSEIEVIGSRDLASRVVTQAKLGELPEFNPALRSPLVSILPRHDLLPDQQMVATVDKFLSRLQVRAAGRSRVINISFTSANPALAAQLANTTADLYLVEQLESKFEATRKATQWLSTRLDELRTKAESAEVAVDQFKRGLQGSALPAEVDTAAVRLRSLEREAQATRALYETVLTRFKETSEQQGLEQADARIISRATIPSTPSFPDVRLALTLALLASAGAGLLLAFAAEKLDGGFRSSDQIEQFLGVPTLAMLPALSSLGIKNEKPEQYIIHKPNSSFAEAVRMLRTTLTLRQSDNRQQVLLIASALPTEGKTTVAVALARLASLAGEKVVVVDADMRRPRVHTALAIENSKGLSELLSGQATIADVLKVSEYQGKQVHVITAGQATPLATELVRSEAMKKFIQGLAANFATVIIDSPPVLPVADCKVLAGMANRIVYVVRWNETRREVAQHAIKQLREAGGALAGVVLNGVDVRRHAEYSYSDSGYYYGRYRKYYVD